MLIASIGDASKMNSEILRIALKDKKANAAKNMKKGKENSWIFMKNERKPIMINNDKIIETSLLNSEENPLIRTGWAGPSASKNL